MRRLACVFLLLAVGSAPAEPPKDADPAATKLLAEARAARASWDHFPGFSADLEVNLDGKVVKGRVEVNPKGKVKLDLPEGEAHDWARRQLGSIVGHRMDGGTSLETPCAFADDNAHHPLGRAIRVLNDEFHSSYRIRDRQIIVVNRQMKDSRFTITVLENRRNAEKQFLPASYVVDTWDAKTDALKSSEAFHQTWVRVGKYDLPRGLTVVAAGTGKHDARELKLSNHQLTAAAQR
jgi:hypothetical protein